MKRSAPCVSLLGLILVTAITVGGLSGQGQVWVVDAAGGAGSQFQNISAALARSADGDRIVVRPGTYPGFSTSKGVAILCDPGVLLNAFLIDVHRVPAGRRFSIRGGWIRHLRLTDCLGSVVVENVQMNSASMDRCANVTFATSRVGSLAVHNSTAVIRNSVLNENGAFPNALLMDGISDCVLAGGDTLGGGSIYGVTPAIRISASSVLTITGDTTTRVRTVPATLPNVPAIDGSGRVILDPRVAVTGSRTTGPAISPTVLLTRRTTPFLDVQGAPLGGVVTVRLQGQPRDNYFLAVGLPGTPRALPGLVGNVWLDLSASVLIGMGTLGASGTVSTTVYVPPDQRLLGAQFLWQASAGPATGPQVVSNPASYVHGR